MEGEGNVQSFPFPSSLLSLLPKTPPGRQRKKEGGREKRAPKKKKEGLNGT